MFSHRSEVSYKSLKSTKNYVIQLKVLHQFDNTYPIVLIAGPIFSTAFYTLADHVFAKSHDPQRECMLLHEIGIYLPKAVQ